MILSMTIRTVAVLLDLALWFVGFWLLNQDRWLLGALTLVLGLVLGAWGSSNWDKWSDPLLYRRDDHFDR